MGIAFHASSTPEMEYALFSSPCCSTLVTCTNSGSLTLWPEDKDKVCMHFGNKTVLVDVTVSAICAD